MKAPAKLKIGRSDRVDFPEWQIFDIDAKVDSGAYTSSIHCENIDAFYLNGEHCIRFIVHDRGKPIITESKIYASKQVRNSFGQIEYRYSVKTIIRLFEESYPIELALTNRSSMKYPVLLGRKLLHDRFIIDVTTKNLSYKEKLKKRIESEKTQNS
ncbi:MAG: ATP-dependent zinc protease [Chitinophagales bacterium]|nr:ATP-dependent zinc protease [Chitinophagales bacterium]